jgi:hypothetical protein
MSESISNVYFIYEIWDSKNNEPIYVGYAKGHKDQKYKRYLSHIKEARRYKDQNFVVTPNLNWYKINVLNQCDEIEYRFPYEDLSYTEVCEKEQQLIDKYGQRIYNTGPLTNLDSGGRAA